MAVGIIYNASANYVHKNLNKANTDVADSIAKLSSGNRITNAKDDVAGLAVGSILKTNVASLKSAVINAGQATAMLQIIEGSLDNISTILSRQKSLASQATSGALSDVLRGYLDLEFQNLANEIDRIADNTNFNDIKLINGSLANSSKTTTIGFAVSNHNDNTVATVDPISIGTGFKVTENITEMPKLTAVSKGSTNVDFSMQIGSKTYTTATPTNLSGYHKAATAGIIEIKLIGSEDANDSITIKLPTTSSTFANAGALASFDQPEANNISNLVNFDFATAKFASIRNIDSFSGVGLLSGGSLSATDIDGEISINGLTAEELGNGAYKVSIQANGKTYSANTSNTGELLTASVVDFIADDGSKLTYTHSASILDISGKTNQLIKDFKESYSGDKALSFQVGTEASNKISISVSSAKIQDLFKDNNGSNLKIDLVEQKNSELAGNVLDNAIRSVVSIRANNGALQSRFEKASENLISSIENMEAARSIFLDTDFAKESTALAQYQIQLQSSISMLAKANSTLEKLAELLR